MVYDGVIWQAKYLRRWPADFQIILEPFTFRPSPASPLAVPFSSRFALLVSNTILAPSWKDSLGIGTAFIGIESSWNRDAPSSSLTVVVTQ